MNKNERMLWVGGHGVLLLLILGLITFISGYWAILIALGPGAYYIVLNAHSSDNAPEMVAISYVGALVVGWLIYMMIAPGIAPTTVKPMSEPGLRVLGCQRRSSSYVHAKQVRRLVRMSHIQRAIVRP